MKNYTQAYVMNSMEAVQTYCRAFGAQVTLEIMNEARNAYAHCELSVDGVPFLAVAEAPEPYDVGIIHKMKWQTMTFNAFELKNQEAVLHALGVLSDRGVVLEPVHALPWSECCATVIDKYGVCWWISM